MRLNEFLSENDLFGAIQAVEQFPFIVGRESTLNAMLSVQYGERMLFDPYEDFTLEEVAEMVVADNVEDWNNYVLQAEQLATLHNEQERTVNTDTGENRTSERNDLNKTAAYNDPELLVEGGADSTNAEETERTETVVEKVIEKDIAKAYSLLDSVVKRSIINKVLKDVSQFLTLDIY